jgi:hypothetical protein
MTFIVEDGTGVDDANALITLAEYRAHFTDRGVDTSAQDDATVQAAIVVATDYIEQRWESCLLGQREHDNQCVSFPRDGICDYAGEELDGVVPKQVKRAVIEYARIAISQSLLQTPTVDESGKAVKRTREKVGPIETETEFQDGSGIDILLRPYPIADRWLEQFLKSGALSRSSGRRFRG